MLDELKQCKEAVSACFETVLPSKDIYDVQAATRYALGGGKYMRAFLVMEGARLHGVPPQTSVWAAAAIEALHAYSLVHDDLPCMDDDDLRRGQPTVHIKWDEATAVLVGDALQSLAFECLCRPELAVSSGIRVELISGLASSAGLKGMVLGQAQDIAAETAAAPLNLQEITALQSNKTGALIEWSAKAGPIMGDADPKPMATYASALGLAFQIHDDVLDVVGDVTKTGKAVGKDAGAGKATFVSLLGLEGAKQRATDLIEAACDALSPYGDEAKNLRDLAQFAIARET